MSTNNQNNRNSFAGSGAISSNGAIKGATIKGGNGNKNNEKFQGNYFQWLASELKNWPTIAWAIFAFAFGFQTHIYVGSPITFLSTITYIAALVGILCCCAMMIGKTINGLLGFISAIGFIYVNYTAGHFASVLDQIVFVALIDLPLMFAWKTWGQNFKTKVRNLNIQGWIFTVIGVLISWGVLYYAYAYLHDSNPVWDSLVLAIGAIASVLCFLHFANTYSMWLVEDGVNVILWFTALQAGYTPAALAMLVSVLMYLTTAIYGRFFSIWHKAIK